MSTSGRELCLLHLGIGQVGRALVQQLLARRQELQADYGLKIRYLGLATSRGALLEPSGFSAEELQQTLALAATKRSLSELGSGDFVASIPEAIAIAGGWQLPGAVLIDTTASDELAPELAQALGRGFDVVLSNKKPLAGTLAEYQALQDACRQSGTRLRYEATVGAGLPVIHTLETLIQTGDELLEIQGSLSGTLGFICTSLEDGLPFSQALERARRLGYCEPDPRQDLEGLDVARKMLILARRWGLPWEPEALQLESMISNELSQEPTVAAFLARLPQLDEEYRQRAEGARASGQVWRYIATVSPEGGSVRLAAVERESSFGQLRGTDSLVQFKTARYRESPLIIRGAGAGPEVTAAGVFGDLLALAGVL
ncbi:MAG TPA: homoserine dehydrogenase [Candidatus Fraserbacteria bacterium]|nr:homoserine dehydrogenase [Candidatus Fraserbacteria bacterium]